MANIRQPFDFSLAGLRLLNTFLPRFLFSLSPWRNRNERHWKNQGGGDPHGYQNYNFPTERLDILLEEVRLRSGGDPSILSLGCNCGFFLAQLKKEGFRSLTGLEISGKALAYGCENFDLEGVELLEGSYQEILPHLAARRRRFDCALQEGSSIEMIHPSFDIVRAICNVTESHVFLMIKEYTRRYPRLWEHEFSREGFALVKCLRPYDGKPLREFPPRESSFLVFQRV